MQLCLRQKRRRLQIEILLPNKEKATVFWDIASNLNATIDFLITSLVSVFSRLSSDL